MFVFGNKSRIALPTLGPVKSAISRAVCFTHPTISPFFSAHGFAFPLHYTGIPFDVIADKKFPVDPKNLSILLPSMRYILIDHDGLMWSVVVQHGIEMEDTNLYLTYAYIPYQNEGWWIASNDLDKHDPDKETLLGFLYTNPKQKAIDDYWYSQRNGKGLDWHDIVDIVMALNIKYPKSVEDEKATDAATPKKQTKKVRRPRFGDNGERF